MHWQYCVLAGTAEPFGGSDIFVQAMDSETGCIIIKPFTVTIDAVGAYLKVCDPEYPDPVLKQERENDRALGQRLIATGKPYWLEPFPGATDIGTDMIVNIEAFSEEDIRVYVRIVLQEKGYKVSSLEAAVF